MSNGNYRLDSVVRAALDRMADNALSTAKEQLQQILVLLEDES